MKPLAHLSPDTRKIAQQDDKERLAFLAEDRWIDYPRAKHILATLESMIKCPPRTRMPGLLIHGESNIGKSMIIQKFLRKHPPNGFEQGGTHLKLDVLAIEMPAVPQERRLYGQILLALHAPYRPSDRLASVELTALTLLERISPKVIIVDEIHNLLAGTAREQRAALNLLKFLSNRLHCAIVVLGTQDAVLAMQTDPQITSRFPGIELARWRANETLRGFLAGFERQLPLRKPSRLADSRAMIEAVMSLSGGITGQITGLLTKAAQAAITQERETISVDLIEAIANEASA